MPDSTLHPTLQQPHFIDLLDDEADKVPAFTNDLTDEEEDDVEFIGENASAAIQSLPPSCRTVNSFQHQKVSLRRDNTVELEDGDFLTIKSLHLTPAGTCLLRGILLRRTKYVNDTLPKKVNEVAMIITVPHSLDDPSIDQCLVVRRLPTFICVRQLIYTNAEFPRYTFREQAQALHFNSWDDVRERGRLVCRWKYISKTHENKVIESSWQRLRQAECTTRYGTSDLLLLSEWVGKENVLHKRGYSFGDLFSGGGGSARGAKMANLRIEIVLDHDADAVQSLRLNFFGPDTKVLHMDIFDFCTMHQRYATFVDILHISFPCQPHSYRQVVPGKNNELNTAVSFALIHILRLVRPRIATFEQTSGIVTKNGGDYYRALINQLTHMDYNVRSTVQGLAEWGNAHNRKRLIVIAACPGEKLPTLPKPTHGSGPGLKPFVTILRALGRLDYNRIPYNMRQEMVRTQRAGQRSDPNQPLRTCITCNGGETVFHYTGTRPWLLAELAALQAFPQEHKFAGSTTSILRQMGNAVPPAAIKVLFRHLIVHLNASDVQIEKDIAANQKVIVPD